MIQVHNTLTNKAEVLAPIQPGKISMYTCGPTVYNFQHIGNLRAALASDIFKRVLTFHGFNVTRVMNITDVDDKTIRDSIATKQSLQVFTKKYTKEYLNDTRALNILPVDTLCLASEHIQEMDEMIHALLERGFAYTTEAGDVFFSIEAFEEYGELSGIQQGSLQSGASGRTNNDEYDKDNVSDFALWKAWRPEDGENFWEPTYASKGRPGWHIECSAMSTQYLGDSFDIHTGGVDLIFPHHENEIAQSKCATNGNFARYWLHNEHLLVDNTKMSKSLGNFYTLRDVIDRGYDPLAFRYLVLQSHYRHKMNFTWESLEAAATALVKLRTLAQKAHSETSWLSRIFAKAEPQSIQRALEESANDFSTAEVLAEAWNIAKSKNMPSAKKYVTLVQLDTILGLDLFKKVVTKPIPENVQLLAKERAVARENKDWKRSDQLRTEIASHGCEVLDTPSGQKLTKSQEQTSEE